MPAQIRKLMVCVDETRIEMGRAVEPPVRRAVAIAVIANPYAGRWSDSLDELVAIGEELGGLLGERCVHALGIAPAAFLELVLASPARSAAAELKGPRMVQGDFTPQSRIRQHLKDLELMLAAAQVAGQDLPLTQAHAALLRAAVAAGDGDLDNAAVVRQIRRQTRP